MNPADAMPKDYGMYYNGCWMRHKKLGVGRIQIIESKMYLEAIEGKSEPIAVRPSMLECWWPRAGAFNYKNHAVYIARRAMRNMRKSAVSGDHYFIKWGTPYDKDPMMVLRDGPNALSLAEATIKMRGGAMSSVAITRDIIILPEDSLDAPIYAIIFRGMEAGRLYHGSYEAQFSGSPLTTRILLQLEGI